jgi:hypothetical protein
MPERSDQYAVSIAYFGRGGGGAALKAAHKIYPSTAARRSPVPTTLFIPRGPMATGVSFIQPQFDYRLPPSPAWALDTNQNAHTENVSVKEG